MDKQLKSTKDWSKSQVSARKAVTDKRDLIVGSIVATLLALTPFYVTLWQYVPSQKSWETFLGTLTSNYYQNVQVFAWTLTSRVVPLFLLIIWMFTNRHWWYHVLLIPIALYIYQIIEIFNDEIVFTETYQIFYLLPVMAVIVPSIYLIRARIFNKINEATKSMQELEDELKISPKNFWGKVKQYF